MKPNDFEKGDHVLLDTDDLFDKEVGVVYSTPKGSTIEIDIPHETYPAYGMLRKGKRTYFFCESRLKKISKQEYLARRL